MATIRSSRALFALGLVALIPAALTACSGGTEAPSDGSASSQTEEATETGTDQEATETGTDQSKEEACKIALDSMTSMSDKITEIAGNPDAAALEEMKTTIETSLSEASDQITNEEVSTAFAAYSDAYMGIFDSENSDAITAVTDAATELGTACA